MNAAAPILSVEEAINNSWHGQLNLSIERHGDCSRLVRRRHAGPIIVQRPFYPEGPVCHLYLIHPPGGVVGGDVLEINVQCGDNSQVLITTPAAGKFYRSGGKTARQTVSHSIGENATFEWLPQETIFFDGAMAKCSTRIQLQQSSRFMAWEFINLGRPACKERFEHGFADCSYNILQDQQPLLLERISFNHKLINANYGMQGNGLYANMFAFPASEHESKIVRDLASGTNYFGATLVGELLVINALANQTAPVRKLFEEIWAALRPIVMHKPACPPRIWAT